MVMPTLRQGLFTPFLSLLVLLPLRLPVQGEEVSPASPAPPDPARIEKLVADLGSASGATREAASKGLSAIGLPAVHPLHRALGDRSPEVRTRAKELLARLLPPNALLREMEKHTGSLDGTPLSIREFAARLRGLAPVPVAIGDGVDADRTTAVKADDATVEELLKRFTAACSVSYVVLAPEVVLVTREAALERRNEVMRNLHQKVTIDCRDVPLRKIIDRLSGLVGFPIRIDGVLRKDVDAPGAVGKKKHEGRRLVSLLLDLLTGKGPPLSIGDKNAHGVLIIERVMDKRRLGQLDKKMARDGLTPPPGVKLGDWLRKRPLDRSVLRGARARIGPAVGGRSIQKAVVSFDGRTLYTRGSDGIIRLWSAATGKELLSFKKDGLLLDIALSPDGRMLASAGDALILWDVTTGEQVARTKEGARWSRVAFSPDGNVLATSFASRLSLWDAAALKHLVKLEGDGARIDALAFSPDGSTLAAAGQDSAVRLWDVSTGKTRAVLSTRKTRMMSVTFSPDGRWVAAGDSGGRIAIWEADSGRALRHFDGGSYLPVWALAFPPDGALLAVGRGPSAFELWDPAAGRRLHKAPAPHPGVSRSLAFASDGKTLHVVWEGGVQVFDVSAHRKKLTPGAPSPAAPDTAALWADLGGADGAKAHAAMRRLAALGEPAVLFLKDRAGKDPAPESAEIARLIAELDHEAFDVREKAVAGLRKFGALAGPALRKALEQGPSAEARGRIRMILADMKGAPRIPPGGSLRRERALLVLEWIGTDGARALLEKAASAAPTDREKREAKAALTRLDRSTEP
jgi:hypothetical protein